MEFSSVYNLSLYIGRKSVGACAVRALIYGVIGLVFEVLWTGLCSLASGDFAMTAHTSLVMLPVYSSAVLLEPMFTGLCEVRLSPLLRGACYAVMIFACEYFSGKLFNLAGLYPWRYVGRLNIEGVIRLDFAPLWVAVGLCYEGIYKMLMGYEKRG